MKYPASVDEIFSFGKYKNKTVGDVLEIDADYIEWCIENVQDFELDDHAYSVYLYCEDNKTWKKKTKTNIKQKLIQMKHKIIENWVAIEEKEKIVREKTGDPLAGFNASTFFLSEEGRHLMLPCMYRPKKGKKGQETFTQSYKEMMVYANYCPFTGKPLYKEYEQTIEHISEEQKNKIAIEMYDKLPLESLAPAALIKVSKMGIDTNAEKMVVSTNMTYKDKNYKCEMNVKYKEI